LAAIAVDQINDRLYGQGRVKEKEDAHGPGTPERGLGWARRADSAPPPIETSEDIGDAAGGWTRPNDLGPIAEEKAKSHRWRPRPRTVVTVLALLLLAALAGGASTLAYLNAERAQDWKLRAERLDLNAAELNRLLIDRSEQLNQRTRDLNSSAQAVRDARAALRRSELDVASLSSRQRALANEKAQVEDEREQLEVQRAALETVAGSYITCKNGLVDLVRAVANDDWDWIDWYYDGIAAACDAAEGALDSYLTSYGG
jgi:hypothetical protein